MQKTKNPLLNKSFLQQILSQKIKQTFIKITSYNILGEPQQSLEGVVTGGTINIDGNSSVRRSCQLSFVVPKETDLVVHEAQWALSTEIEILLGIRNFLDSDYPEIIWFPQGHYLISAFTVNQDLNKYNINISGKDKMCKLNGELGGMITSLSTDMGEIQDLITGLSEKLSLKDVIKNLVVHYGLERYDNVELKDLDILRNDLMEYRGDTPLFLLKDSLGNYINFITDETAQVAHIRHPETILFITDESIEYERLGKLTQNTSLISQIYLVKNGVVDTSNKYTLTKIEYGEPVGYKPGPLVFNQELVGTLGENIASILDKIKQLLGPYEYFYDLDGRFIFQRKPQYLDIALDVFNEFNGVDIVTTPHNLDDYEGYWALSHEDQIVSIAETTPINNIKNDYSIWGKKSTGAPLHYRCALATRPTTYTNYEGITYSIENYNWREILYQMAYDKYKYGAQTDFLLKLIKHNPQYANGVTGYEVFYTDMLEFWRQLYNPEPQPLYKQIAYNTDSPNKFYKGYIPYNELTAEEKLKVTIADLYTVTPSISPWNRAQVQRWIDIQDLTKTGAYLGWYCYVQEEQDDLQFTSLNFYTNYADIPDAYKDEVWQEGALVADVTEHGAAQGWNYSFLDQLYLSQDNTETKLINTLNYKTAHLYIKQEGEYIYLPETLTDELKEKIYYSIGEDGVMKKYVDGYNLQTYNNVKDSLELFSNAFWLNKADDTQHYEIYEIYFLSPSSGGVAIWQRDDLNPLSQKDLDLIRAAERDHGAQLFLHLVGEEQWYQLQSNDNIFVRAYNKNDKVYLWYCESNDLDKKMPLADYILYDIYATKSADSVYSKYDIYFKQDNAYYSTLELLDVPVDALRIRTMDIYGIPRYEPLVEYWPFPKDTENIFVKAEQLMPVIKLEADNMSGIASQYIKDSQFQPFLLKQKTNIYGTPHVLYPNVIKEEICYYDQYYTYFLNTVRLDGSKDYRECWKKDIYYNFSLTNFWIDFIDGLGAIQNNIGQKIGYRQKCENSDNFTAIDFAQVPPIRFVDKIGSDLEQGYYYIEITDTLNNIFGLHTQKRSCKERSSEWIQQHGILNTSLTITMFPNYILQPNWILNIPFFNKDDYEITRISLNLSNNGKMTINANKIIELE